MVPAFILKQLARTRRREKRQRFVWGVSRALALFLIVLLLACGVDWLIDRFQETPWPVRIGLLAVNGTLTVIALVSLVLWPLARRLRDAELALWVEDKHPQLRHRLISAVELNQPAARHDGMSGELIDVVTWEAEQQARAIHFPSVVDRSRLRWSFLLLTPVLLLFAAPFLLWPEVYQTLIARHFLAEEDIPRGVYLTQGNPQVWPRGETVRLEIEATGPDALREDLEGELVIHWDRSDLPKTRLPLGRIHMRENTAFFAVDVPAASVNFRYTARLGDGRLKEAGLVRYEPRPEVKHEAFLVLPEFCGKTPAGQRYEQPAGRGDVEGIAGSSVRVVIEVPEAAVKARVHLFMRRPVGKDGGTIEEPHGFAEIKLAEASPAALAPGVTPTKQGSVVFPLSTKAGAYSSFQIEVVDRFGFPNRPRPTRGIRVIPEPRPEVALLREQFPPGGGLLSSYAEDYIFAGIPALEDGKVRVGYKCFGPYGLGCAYLEYRKVPQAESGNDVVSEDEWTQLPLPEMDGDPESVGPFIPDLGAFAKTSFLDSIGFHAVPSPQPETQLGRIVGGGRYDLDLAGLLRRFKQKNARGKETVASVPLQLKKGDKVEYRVKVYADRDPNSPRPWNASETRVTTIEDVVGVMGWLEASRGEQDRVRGLEKNQRAVFEKLQ